MIFRICCDGFIVVFVDVYGLRVQFFDREKGLLLCLIEFFFYGDILLFYNECDQFIGYIFLGEYCFLLLDFSVVFFSDVLDGLIY